MAGAACSSRWCGGEIQHGEAAELDRLKAILEDADEADPEAAGQPTAIGGGA